MKPVDDTYQRALDIIRPGGDERDEQVSECLGKIMLRVRMCTKMWNPPRGVDGDAHQLWPPATSERLRWAARMACTGVYPDNGVPVPRIMMSMSRP